MFDVIIPGKYNMTLIWNKHMNFFIKISRETQVLQNNMASRQSFNSDWTAHLMKVALALWWQKCFRDAASSSFSSLFPKQQRFLTKGWFLSDYPTTFRKFLS